MITVVDLSTASNADVATWLVDLSEDLRPGDYDEIRALSEETPAVVLVSSVMLSSQAWMIFDGDVPIAAFGVAPSDDPARGIVWMLGSPKMDLPANAVGILRLSRHYKDEMHRTYDTLYNYIDARHTRSLKWLEWCGYQLIEEEPEYGLEARPFFLFERHRPHV
jgi:hypothetical protein